MIATPDQYGMQYEDLTLTTEDGVKISAWYVHAPEPAKGQADSIPASSDSAQQSGDVVLFCHGNGQNISFRLESVRIFHNMGLSVLIFDYRGYGRSEGSPSEEGTYADARAAWDYLVHTRKIPPPRIIVFGRSLGGAVAAHVAKEHAPKALILESTFTSVPDYASDIYPFLPVRLLCRFSYDTHSIIGDVPCPVLIVHSPEDEIVDFSYGRRLFEAASEPKEFLEITGSHNSGFLTSRATYTDGLKSFLAGLGK